jgi:hypothetical protein
MKKVVLAVALVVMSGRTAPAVLFTDHFDSYANQSAFQTAWPVGTGATRTLSSAQSVSAPNSINLATTAGRNDRNVGEAGQFSPTNSLRFSFDFYDSNGAAFPYRQISTIVDSAAATSGGGLISMGLDNTMDQNAQGGNFYFGRILGVSVNGGASGAVFKMNDNPALLRSTGWHNLAVEISFNTATTLNYKFFVDNQLAETVNNVTVTNRSFDTIRLGSGVTSSQVAFIDNVRFENFDPTAVVPEAGSFAAVGLVGLLSAGAVWIRKRRAGQAAA